MSDTGLNDYVERDRKARSVWKKSAPPMTDAEAKRILSESMVWLSRMVDGSVKQSKELREMLRGKGIWLSEPIDDPDWHVDPRPIFKTKKGKFRRMKWP